MNFNRMTIAHKLWIFIAIVVLSIVSVAVLGLMRSASILGAGRIAQLNAIEMAQIASQWTGLTQTNAVRNQAIILSSDPSVSAAFKDEVTATSAQISELQKRLDAMPQTEADKAQLQKTADLRKTVIALRETVRGMKVDGKSDEAMQMMTGKYLPARPPISARKKIF